MTRRRGGVAPPWAPKTVDVPLEAVHPLPGWVVIREQFDQDREVTLAGVTLIVATPGTSNTVMGYVLALHPETREELGIRVGDLVAYREWEGGRWSFEGASVLLMESQHILGLVAE